jgi:hypothetical protein
MNTKVAIAAEHAFAMAGNRDFSIMKVDADDLIATDLLATAEQRAPAHGFVINRGYLQRLGSPVLWKHYRFHEICGTSVSLAMRRNGTAQFRSPGEFADLYLKNYHAKFPELLAGMGRPLSFLPIWGAIYTMDHGDNSSGNRLGRKWRPWRMEFVRPRIAREFPGVSFGV